MSKISLSDISNPIKEELSIFNDLFQESLKSKVSLVDLVAKYILKQKGKKIRPLLVLLSAKASGQINERSYRGAILVELLHSATLIHDDVVDSAEKRRGFPSINAIWKNKIAVLMGDYLLAKGLMISVDGNDFDFLKTITDTVRRMSEGELLQISKTRKLDIDSETYFKIISDKTASLLSTCCEIGAASTNDNPNVISSMKEFGESLGIAFQIRDDILDYVGKSSIIGKPQGGDIKEKKITLPLIYALSQSDSKEASSIIKIVKNGAKKGRIEEVIEFVDSKGGIEFADKTAREFADNAMEKLNVLDESESKTALQNLVRFVVERKK